MKKIRNSNIFYLLDLRVIIPILLIIFAVIINQAVIIPNKDIREKQEKLSDVLSRMDSESYYKIKKELSESQSAKVLNQYLEEIKKESKQYIKNGEYDSDFYSVLTDKLYFLDSIDVVDQLEEDSIPGADYCLKEALAHDDYDTAVMYRDTLSECGIPIDEKTEKSFAERESSTGNYEEAEYLYEEASYNDSLAICIKHKGGSFEDLDKDFSDLKQKNIDSIIQQFDSDKEKLNNSDVSEWEEDQPTALLGLVVEEENTFPEIQEFKDYKAGIVQMITDKLKSADPAGTRKQYKIARDLLSYDIEGNKELCQYISNAYLQRRLELGEFSEVPSVFVNAAEDQMDVDALKATYMDYLVSLIKNKDIHTAAEAIKETIDLFTDSSKSKEDDTFDYTEEEVSNQIISTIMSEAELPAEDVYRIAVLLNKRRSESTLELLEYCAHAYMDQCLREKDTEKVADILTRLGEKIDISEYEGSFLQIASEAIPEDAESGAALLKSFLKYFGTESEGYAQAIDLLGQSIVALCDQGELEKAITVAADMPDDSAFNLGFERILSTIREKQTDEIEAPSVVADIQTIYKQLLKQDLVLSTDNQTLLRSLYYDAMDRYHTQGEMDAAIDIADSVLRAEKLAKTTDDSLIQETGLRISQYVQDSIDSGNYQEAWKRLQAIRNAKIDGEYLISSESFSSFVTSIVPKYIDQVLSEESITDYSEIDIAYSLLEDNSSDTELIAQIGDQIRTKKASACHDAYLQVIENMAESGEFSNVMGYAQIELEGAEYPILLIHSYTGNKWLSYQDGTVLSGTYPFGAESTYRNMLVLQSSPSYSDSSKKIESNMWIRYELDDDGSLAIKDYYAEAVSESLGLSALNDVFSNSDSTSYWNAHDQLSSEEDIPANPDEFLSWDGDLNAEFYDEFEAEQKEIINVSRLSELPLFEGDELAFEAEPELTGDIADEMIESTLLDAMDSVTAAAETDAPETETPETVGPETVVSESSIVETDVPETVVSESSIVETDVPETVVPESSIEETDVPETVVPESSIEETDAPETETPKAAVPETTPPETSSYVEDAVNRIELCWYLGESFDSMIQSVPDLTQTKQEEGEEKWENDCISVTGISHDDIVRMRFNSNAFDYQIFGVYPGMPSESVEPTIESLGFNYVEENDGWHLYENTAGTQIAYQVESDKVLQIYVAKDGYMPVEIRGENDTNDTSPDSEVSEETNIAADTDEEWEAVRTIGMQVGDPVTVPGDFYRDGKERIKETGYILPQTATKYLTEEDVAHLSMKGCCYARNEIYARHGRQFNASELKDYFTARSWYEGTVSPDDFTDSYSRSAFNDYEYQNATFLWDYETKNGMYWPE